MARILCLDYGEVRIGIAISDPSGIIASPHPFIKNDKNTIYAIQKMINDKDIGCLVIGLPLNLKGEYSKKTEEVKAFSEEIKENISIPVELWDERFSTVSAERILREANIKNKKQRQFVDSLSAQIILQNYLDSKKY